MTYELWDLQSRNMIDWFEQSDEALEVVRAYPAAGEAALVAVIVRDESGVIVESVTDGALHEWAASLGDPARHTV